MKTRKQTSHILISCSAAHFLCDLACHVLIRGTVVPYEDGKTIFASLILYNLFAFAFQLPLGAAADKLNKNGFLAASGFVLCAAGVFIPQAYAVSIVSGIGNAAFHIGAGLDVLNISHGKSSFPGVFVSTGAAAVFAAPYIVKSGVNISAFVLVVCAAGLAFVLPLAFFNKRKYHIMNVPARFPRLHAQDAVSAVLLTLNVVARSFIGTYTVFAWKSQFLWALAFTGGIVLGKAIGGIIADRAGMRITGCASLLLSAVLLMFSDKAPVVGVASVMLFNMSMPLTLSGLVNIFPDAKGFAFGLTTAALFAGVFPKLLGAVNTVSVRILIILTVVNCVLMFFGLRGRALGQRGTPCRAPLTAQNDTA